MPTPHPRYLTYSTEQLTATLSALDDTPGRAAALAVALKHGGTGTGTMGTRTSGSRLLKSHTCSVVFPDSVAGSCAYTRYGPAWHQFQFQHGGDSTGFAPVALPRFYWNRTLGNTQEAVAAKATELTVEVYALAALREQKEYFARASENAARKKRPGCVQMSTARAKQLAGKYAVCYQLGDRFLPVQHTYAHLKDANYDWEQRGNNTALFVACCNRLDRCWELPYFNPLYATFDPRPKPPAEGAR